MGFGGRADGPRIRVLVVDGDERARVALRAVIDSQSDLELVGAVASGDEALAAVDRFDPDVVLMDCATASAFDGAAVFRRGGRSSREPRIVLLTMSARLDDGSRAWGADPVVVEGCTSETLLESLRRVRGTRAERDQRHEPDPTPRRESHERQDAP